MIYVGCYLPNRQLRNQPDEAVAGVRGYLPNRQLRKF